MSEYPSYRGPLGSQTPGQRPEDLPQQAARAGRQVQSSARRVSDSLMHALDRGRAYAAAGLARAADTLRSSSDGNVSARRFAESLEQGAGYLRRTDLNGMQRDMEGLIKQRPFQALGVAFLVGIILGRRLGRR